MGRLNHEQLSRHDLLLLPEGRSVQLNTATDEDYILGVFIWAMRPWQKSNSATKTLDFPVRNACSVSSVYKVLRNAGIYSYQFFGGGSGCFHWV